MDWISQHIMDVLAVSMLIAIYDQLKAFQKRSAWEIILCDRHQQISLADINQIRTKPGLRPLNMQREFDEK